MATVAQRLREALKTRNMKQSDLVAATGIGKSSISTYLSGEYEPKQRNIFKMAKALNVNEAWLMGEEVEMDMPDFNSGDAYMSLGENLRAARKRAGFTQKQLAELIGAKHNSISNWENNQNKPNPDTIKTICDVLNISSNQLLGTRSSDNTKVPTPGLSAADERDIARDLERLNTDLENADNQIFDGNHTMELGEIINFYLKQNEMTIDQLSEKSNVAKGTLNKIINGVTEDPQFETVKSIAKALGCTLDDLDDSMSYKNRLITQGKEDESIGIGNRIKQARECLGYTQKELAEKVGVTSSAIANYENGISHPKKNIMYALMETLKIDANFLFQDCIKTASPLDTATPAEMEYLIKKYRCLDEHGKEIVDIILSIEYNRCIGLSE